MSTQLEFIMQLYMMNLLQQQQQQQHQQQTQQLQQQLSPTKQKDNMTTATTTIAPAETTETPATTTAAATMSHKRERPHNSRTQKREISQNNNCSSSSSSSPNSNSSPANTYMPTTNPLQQLLLNTLSPLTRPALVPPLTNLPLTPNTPNSSAAPVTPASSSLALQQLTDLFGMGNGLSGNCNSNILPYPYSNLCGQFSAQNFLQSSTVTSTPTEKSPLPKSDISTISDVYVVNDVKKEQQDAEVAHSMSTILDVERAEDVVETDEEDDKPLSSLYSSSGVASTSTGSGETSSKLLMSGMQHLESTSDSYESPNAPYTPNKQPADSSISTISAAMSQSLDPSTYTQINYDNEDSNVTPLVQTNTMPTPPSSEHLVAKTFESSLLATGISNHTSLPVPSHTSTAGIDSLLANEDNLKNLRKVSSYLECENSLCRQENLREHFHCHEEPCQGKILSKKDDIIRHLKWHKKRKESLQLGFARFTSSDDCAPEYGMGCSYNWKQTHYHCIYEDCPKVYVSTSDVQMHANFHRKNSEIVQEGFRRFRAHENCKIEDCPFYGKKISHYHCCREGCNHTFKNKADMEKHKSYHLKDYQLTQDGFKKILKTEPCPFEACKFSTVCNHIHCVRENCNYILHSSSQMISHKRKHDRLDSEQAYQNFKKEKDSSEEESPTPVPHTNASTPLSSLSAEHFLSRKRGRPPKKIVSFPN